MKPPLLLTRLSVFYLIFFILLGIILPYWSPYLKSLGMSEAQIGWILACFHFSRLYAPSLWGWVADQTGRRLAVMRLGAVLGSIVILLLPFQTSFVSLILVILTFSFFWNAILPQFEVITLDHLGTQADRYGRIRLWGSVGFIVSVLVGAQLFEGEMIAWVPYALILSMFAIALISFWVPPVAPVGSAEVPTLDSSDTFRSVLSQPLVIKFLLLVFFAQLAHGPYNGFYTLLLQHHQYENSLIGVLWTLGVLAEVALFAMLHRFWKRFSLLGVLGVSLGLAVLRWLLLTFFADTLWVVVVAQLLHAASFAVLHASGIRLVHQLFPKALAGRGQAIHASIGWGLGGVFGAISAGYLWDYAGPSAAFLMASIASSIALLLLISIKLDGKAQQNN